MRFDVPPPGTSGLGQAAPPGLVRATPGVAARRTTLSSVSASSTSWASSAQARVSWVTTLVGWGVLLLAGVAAWVSLRADDSVFGWLASFGRQTWVPIGLSTVSIGCLLATACATWGMRRFHGRWATVYGVGCVSGAVASLGLVAAVALGVAIAAAIIGLIIGIMVVALE